MEYEHCYDVILNGHEAETEKDALDFARGYVFSESECSTQNIGYGQFVDTIDGIDVYYNYGADYYFFCDNFWSEQYEH